MAHVEAGTLCEKLGRVGMVVPKSSILKSTNRCSVTNGPAGTEPHEAGGFICFVRSGGLRSQNRTQWAHSKESKVERD